MRVCACVCVIVCVCAWRPLIPIEVATASIVRGGCSLEPMTPTITLFALPSLATTSPPEIVLPKKKLLSLASMSFEELPRGLKGVV